ncbi:MAG: hypothetical protein M3N14_02800, partial [Bacteroidota bacterium]|nr:hypothetical protein [Bacteroidota bacterium]
MTPITPAKAVTAGVIAAVIGSIVTLRIGKRFVPAIPFLVLAALAVLCLIGIIIYLLTWQHKAKRKQMDPGQMFAFWQDVIRYFIATDMIMFA